MKNIIIIEGADGTGKTTLASAIRRELNGSVIHATFNKTWDMEQYHEDIMEAALDLSLYTPIILDRWAVSEEVYGPIFRKKPSYDTWQLIKQYKDQCVWIYCRNNNVEANHQKNMNDRKEMFNTMDEVQRGYDQYFIDHLGDMFVLYYDFDHDGSPEDMERFIKLVKKEMKWEHQ